MRIALSCSALLLGLAATAGAQTVITPPAAGAPIVSGGAYVYGTVFANGMAYPPGTVPPATAATNGGVIQAGAISTAPGVTYTVPSTSYYIPSSGYTYPTQSYVYYGPVTK